MIAFAGMLLEPARQAGMKVPEDADDFVYEAYPHFQVYLNIQLGSSLPYPSAHWDNAKVIAAIPEDKIRSITWDELKEKVAIGFSIP